MEWRTVNSLLWKFVERKQWELQQLGRHPLVEVIKLSMRSNACALRGSFKRFYFITFFFFLSCLFARHMFFSSFFFFVVSVFVNCSRGFFFSFFSSTDIAVKRWLQASYYYHCSFIFVFFSFFFLTFQRLKCKESPSWKSFLSSAALVCTVSLANRKKVDPAQWSVFSLLYSRFLSRIRSVFFLLLEQRCAIYVSLSLVFSSGFFAPYSLKMWPSFLISFASSSLRKRNWFLLVLC